MKVYTRQGDKGGSRLANGSYLEKDRCQFRVLGAIDELNSWLGLVSSLVEDKRLKKILAARQRDLFEAGRELGRVRGSKKFSLKRVRQLEKEIDFWQKELPRLKSFIYPGGHQEAALLHLCRTACRRAEQDLISLKQEEAINEKILIYFNRLSDWLFVLARKVNREKGMKEEVWKDARRRKKKKKH
jgi:cob(I)alamin adenosyltransferase